MVGHFICRKLNRKKITKNKTLKISFHPNCTDKLGNNFEQLMDHRMREAKRSIIVQVLSENSYNDLYSYCGRFGKIVNSYYYIVASSKNSDDSNNILLEFETAESARNALQSGAVRESHASEPMPPAKSRFMWFASNKNSGKLKLKSAPVKLITNQVAEVDKVCLYESMQLAESISAQMQILYDKTHLNELAVRMRFMAALQIEELFNGIFPDTRVYPFGSSVNGFGKLGSDLDLILIPFKDLRQRSNMHANSRLLFHEKKVVCANRKPDISTIAGMLSVFAPGIENVIPIPRARIPIVKYYQTLLGLHVDLSMANL